MRAEVRSQRMTRKRYRVAENLLPVSPSQPLARAGLAVYHPSNGVQASVVADTKRPKWIMLLVKRSIREAAIVVGALVGAAVLGLGASFVALHTAGLLCRAPVVAITIVALILLLIGACLFPILLAALGIAGTIHACGYVMSTTWAVVVAGASWWLVANLIARWSERWSDNRSRSRRRLLRLWQASVYWGSNILSYLCPAALALVLFLTVRR